MKRQRRADSARAPCVFLTLDRSLAYQGDGRSWRISDSNGTLSGRKKFICIPFGEVGAFFYFHMLEHCSVVTQAVLFLVPRLCLHLISSCRVIKDSENSTYLMKWLDVFWCSIYEIVGCYSLQVQTSLNCCWYHKLYIKAKECRLWMRFVSRTGAAFLRSPWNAFLKVCVSR